MGFQVSRIRLGHRDLISQSRAEDCDGKTERHGVKLLSVILARVPVEMRSFDCWRLVQSSAVVRRMKRKGSSARSVLDHACSSRKLRLRAQRLGLVCNLALTTCVSSLC